jgi:hypothetical protein
MLNRNARKMLHERLDVRNLCGHPTKYRPLSSAVGGRTDRLDRP